MTKPAREVVVLASEDYYKAVAARNPDGSITLLTAFRDDPTGLWDRDYTRLLPDEVERLARLFVGKGNQ